MAFKLEAYVRQASTLVDENTTPLEVAGKNGSIELTKKNILDINKQVAVCIKDGTTDAKGNLIYDPKAIADIYRDDEFGIDIKIMDINFDGHPDIVTFGSRYLYGTNLTNQKTDKVFLNNGKGQFNIKSIDISKLNPGCIGTCQLATWFLKGKDNTSYNIMSYSRFGDKKTFYSQTVTVNNPLVFK
jgi:hypothetical protein